MSGYKRCILTPNLAEFGRLAEGVGLQLPGSISPQWQEHTQSLATAFGGVTVLSKGPTDTISDGESTTHIDLPAGLKRAGGQGDVLTGESWHRCNSPHSYTLRCLSIAFMHLHVKPWCLAAPVLNAIL